MPLVMIPFAFLAHQGLVDSRFYNGDSIMYLIVSVYLVASTVYLWYLARQPKSLAVDVAFSFLFHLLTLLFVLFISGFLSAFLAVWIVLMISADMRFGTKGFFGSFLALCVAGVLMVWTYPFIPTSEQLEIIQGAIVVGAIGYVIARIRALTDRERVDLAKTREKEAYQRERLLALVNSMGDAVVATDNKGIINVYNSTLLSLLDTNLNLTGKSIDEVLQLRDKDNKPIKIMADAAARRAVFSRTDLSRTFGEGDIIKLYINVAPIQPSYQSRAEQGYIFILRDITKEKTVEEERDEFVSVVSHELRTPVTIAEGNLSNIKLMFERGADKKMLSQAVEDAHDQIIYLSRLVNDLSTLARAERGTGGAAEPIDISEMLHSMYTEYTPQAEAKKLQLNIEVPSKLPLVTTNRLYLQEIMQNFIVNAIKYTPSGSVTIVAQKVPEGLSLEVRDTGIGIGKADQKHIFEKFYRSEDYRTRESSGTGLGLYVCKKLAEKLGYRINFESRLNNGSTFGLLIPNETKPVKTSVLPGNTHSAPSN